MRMSCRQCRSRRDGFTLIELLVVMVIIVILIGFIFGAIRAGMHAAAVATAKTEIKSLAAAIDSYRNEYGTYPAGADTSNTALLSTLSGSNPKRLTFLVFEARRVDPITGAFKDPWGNPYYISTTTGSVRTGSSGPDSTANTADDLRSW